MTKYKTRPPSHYQAFLVRPDAGFAPKNWQDKPKSYRVLQYVGSMRFLGRADAWRFMHNHRALEASDFSSWAIFLE